MKRIFRGAAAMVMLVVSFYAGVVYSADDVERTLAPRPAGSLVLELAWRDRDALRSVPDASPAALELAAAAPFANDVANYGHITALVEDAARVRADASACAAEFGIDVLGHAAAPGR